MNGLTLCKTCRMWDRCMKIMLKNPQHLDMTCRAETKSAMETFDTVIASIDIRKEKEI